MSRPRLHDNSELFTAAHRYARRFDGLRPYPECFQEALRQAHAATTAYTVTAGTVYTSMRHDSIFAAPANTTDTTPVDVDVENLDFAMLDHDA